MLGARQRPRGAAEAEGGPENLSKLGLTAGGAKGSMTGIMRNTRNTKDGRAQLREIWTVRGVPEDVIERLSVVATIIRRGQGQIVAEALQKYLDQLIRKRKIGRLVKGLTRERRQAGK